MTPDTLNFPTARSWRDIPQPVVPRAMSREGRWRLAMAVVRAVAVVVVAGMLGWGLWLVWVSVHENTRAMPAAAKSTPMKPPKLSTDGVLDEAWLNRTLALPAHASLMELDLQKLRARILADDQVINATLTRSFPDVLEVRLTERTPVARVMAEWQGQQQMLLVARDGVIFAGTGYAPALLESLPWLDGIRISPLGVKFRPIDGMQIASELLAKARLEAEHLYATWQIVSLARLAVDHRIEVRTGNGLTITFNAREDFFRQLVKLDYVVDNLPKVPGITATIDLSLGSDVPVMVASPEPSPAKPGTKSGAGAGPRLLPAEPAPLPQATAFFSSPNPSRRNPHREF